MPLLTLRRLVAVLVLPLTLTACGGGEPGGEAAPEPTLRVNGSTTVNPVVSRAAEILRAEEGMTIHVDTQGGSSGGISALGDGRVEVAMSSRPVEERDRQRYPETDFRPVAIGIDALAMVVAHDVWEGGVESLSREEIRAIYEGEITEWSAVGGPAQRIVFLNKEPGRGTWEVFADWLYGDAAKAPAVSHPEVGSNEEGRTKVASTPGAISQLSAAWADGEGVRAVAVETEEGPIAPTEANLASGRYPLARPLYVITDGAPGPGARRLIDLLLSSRGQELVRDAGYLGLDALEGSPR